MTVTHLKAHRFFVLPDAQNEIQALIGRGNMERKNRVSHSLNFEEGGKQIYKYHRGSRSAIGV
jgi:hypothetical protein